MRPKIVPISIAQGVRRSQGSHPPGNRPNAAHRGDSRVGDTLEKGLTDGQECSRPALLWKVWSSMIE